MRILGTKRIGRLLSKKNYYGTLQSSNSAWRRERQAKKPGVAGCCLRYIILKH